MRIFPRRLFNFRKMFQIRFYNRLMLYNTIIFLVVAYLLAFLASRYALQLDTVKQLQQSRDALNAVYNYYDSKQDNFLNLIFSLYDAPDNFNYDVLSDMLESNSDTATDTDPFVKQKIVKVMEGVANRDNDISAILIYKNLTGARYVYTRQNGYLERVGDDFPFFEQLKQKTAGRFNFGTHTIESRSISQQVFGISGTLGTKVIRQKAGQFLVAYNAQAFDRILQVNKDKTRGRFIIATNDGDLIFDSDGLYNNGVFPNVKLLKSDNNHAVIDGKRYFIQTILNENRQYIGANLVPITEINQNNGSIRFLIFGSFTTMALICAILYTIAGRFVSRRVMELIRGMNRVSSNNLSYRIPLNNRNDEFEDIAKRFNLMCNELEITINREYVNEIKKKNAELQALQAGINPHFLYNTLEAIRIKAIDDGNNNVAEMIVLLAHLYRSIVRDKTFIHIRNEINMCDMYLNIFALRYASNLDYEINIEPQLMEYGIPKNLLQPIIENYFVHGIRLNNESNRFTIHGYLQGEDICFRFEDNGRGMNGERLSEVRNRMEPKAKSNQSSYGLFNVNERIKLVYGESYGLLVKSQVDTHTEVIVRIRALTCEQLENNLYGTAG
jgi:two-component system sensor histidine kinase YesM